MERQFYQTVLSWDPTCPPPAAAFPAAPASAVPAPVSFPSAAAYQSFFLPLLLRDFHSQLQQSYAGNSQSASWAALLQPLAAVRAREEEREERRGAGEAVRVVDFLHQPAAAAADEKDRRGVRGRSSSPPAAGSAAA